MAFTPQMPQPEHPRPSEWVNTIASLVNKADFQCFFIGHSLGCTAILRYLESLPSHTRVGGAVLVAGPTDHRRVVELKPFFNKPFDWTHIRQVCPHVTAIYSDNDPLVPLASGTLLQEKLGARLLIEKGMGHFSGEEGHLTLPVVLDAIEEMSA